MGVILDKKGGIAPLLNGIVRTLHMDVMTFTRFAQNCNKYRVLALYGCHCSQFPTLIPSVSVGNTAKQGKGNESSCAMWQFLFFSRDQHTKQK